MPSRVLAVRCVLIDGSKSQGLGNGNHSYTLSTLYIA